MVWEEHHVCSDQPLLQCELTALKQRPALLVLWVEVLNFVLRFFFPNKNFGNLRLPTCSKGWQLWKGNWKSSLNFLVINILKRQLVRKANESKFSILVISTLHESSPAFSEEESKIEFTHLSWQLAAIKVSQGYKAKEKEKPWLQFTHKEGAALLGGGVGTSWLLVLQLEVYEGERINTPLQFSCN